MAVTQVSLAPSRERYDAVRKLLDFEANRPAGLIVHAASELPSGEVQIISVWDSHGALEVFAQSRLLPAFAQAGVEVSGDGPVAYDAFDLAR